MPIAHATPIMEPTRAPEALISAPGPIETSTGPQETLAGARPSEKHIGAQTWDSWDQEEMIKPCEPRATA